MPKTLNIAVIGAGTMAQAVHLPVLRRRWDRFAIAALVDHSTRRRREASEVWGVAEEQRYESVADLIAAVRAKTLRLDAAVLATDGLHVADLLALMRRGIPVLAEPPLGYSAEEIAEVADFERMTGRRLLMMAYPQQYDDSVTRMTEHIPTKDLRMVDYEVLMPASQPLYGGAHVTTSSYDLPTEVRKERRQALQAAVEAGSGGGATQRDRDLYVKGLLTGVAHQLAVLEATYGPLTSLRAVRHWPKNVIPGSLEILGELEGGAQVRLVWHYLPFAPEYSERLQVLSARRRLNVDIPAPSHGDRRSTLSLREKKSGVVQETATTAPKGSVELMWEAFHTFVEKGRDPVSGAADAQQQVSLLREVLAAVVAADGRSLEAADPEEADGPDEAASGETDTTTEASASAESGTDAEPADAPPSGIAPAAVAPADVEPAPETLEQPAAELEDEPGAAPEPAPETLEQPAADPEDRAPADGASAGTTGQGPAEEVVDVWDLDAPEAPDAATAPEEPTSAASPEAPDAATAPEEPREPRS